MVFPSLEEFPTVCCVPQSQRLMLLSFSVSTVHEESSGIKGFGISQRQTVSYLFAKEFPLISLLGLKH